MSGDGTGRPGLPDWTGPFCREHRLPAGYARDAAAHAEPLARRILALHERLGRAVVIGISGAQGSGKTTFAQFLEYWLRREHGSACARLSLDDLYLGRDARRSLARSTHPLLATRGVPGTHDLPLARQLLDELTEAAPRNVRLPVFDKATDDRAPAAKDRSVTTPLAAVLFEGWCMGARPQAEDALAEPVNQLEAVEDADGRWRRHVNERLGADYAELFRRLDALVLLRVPSFAQVSEWRRLQERKLREASPAGTATLTDAEVDRFVMHFERLTRHMLETLPGQADSVIEVDQAHRLAGREDRGWAGGAASRPPAG